MTGQESPQPGSTQPGSTQPGSTQPGSTNPESGEQPPGTVSLNDQVEFVAERKRASGPEPPPESFGRYRILRKLGEGGMGSVYLAHDSQLDGPVALKIPRLASGREQIGESRFLREARAAFRIRHAGICPVYDVGEIDGQHFISMAYIQGHTLSQVEKPVDAKRAVQIVGQLAQALQVAHQKGIVHRDLKPDNVMIDEEENPIIMDFGLARFETSEESRLTQTGAIMGTPCYMPLEQVQGEVEKIGPHTDIYSLGVMLYELLTGTLPFDGSPWAVLGQIVTKEPEPPSQRNAKIVPRLEAVCLKAMAKQIEDRFTSMAELCKALDESISVADTPTVTPPPTTIEPAGTVEPSPQNSSSPAAPSGLPPIFVPPSV
ncbi:MAG: serine/threonine protein kinase, partial [Planctomycetaceae bacterium]|nr:serine/threonine protein kinase [Planctomycetaceae bacterium]